MTREAGPAADSDPRPARSRVRLLVLGLIVLAMVLFIASGGTAWLEPAHVQARRFALLAYARDHFFTVYLGLGAVYVLVTALSLPGAAVLSLLNGFLFGRIAGTVLNVVAATIGATVLLVAARYLFADAARRRLEKSRRAARLLDGFDRGAFNYLLFLRLVPVFPYWLVNLAAAVTRIPLRTYVAGTVIGIAPGSFVYANLGQSLGSIKSLHGLLSTEVLLALGLLGVLSLLPLLFTRRRGDAPSDRTPE